VELEPQWAELARHNLALAAPDGDREGHGHEDAGRFEVRQGDARHLAELLADLVGAVDLVATSPPYGCTPEVIDKRAWLAGEHLGQRATRN